MIAEEDTPIISEYNQPKDSNNDKQKQSLPSTNMKKTQSRGTAAYYAKTRKEISTNQYLKSEKDTINLDDYEETNMTNYSITACTIAVQLHGINLVRSDIELLESEQGWLNEKLINVGQKLLHEKFPDIEGLNDVGCSDTLTYPEKKTTNFVQILNVRRSHWVCVSTKVDPNTVQVYDSYRMGNMAFTAKEAIAAMIMSADKVVTLSFPKIQQQIDSSSCGLFSLANAYTLCEGKDPVMIKYDASRMRSHFLSCIQQKEISAFPSKNIEIICSGPTITEIFNVHCICRLPDGHSTGEGLICCSNCKEKFHLICLGFDLEPKEWYCLKCSIYNHHSYSEHTKQLIV